MSFVKPLLISVTVASFVGPIPAIANSETFMNGRSIYGYSVPDHQGKVVHAATLKSINVRCGDTVTFTNGGKQFSWKFDVAGHRSVALNKVAPPDFGSSMLTVYVSPREDEVGG